ncbi:MAG: hypothetical protein IPP44_01525 [Ideonella sp.]|nr:hypothetical protein [Ideonella sp.]
MIMTSVLLFAFVALSIVAAAIALLAWRSWRRRQQGIDGPPSAVPSDWQEVTQRYRASRIEALRDWMGEDHELVRELPAQARRSAITSPTITSVPSTAANSTEVSRSAATLATGARVKAHSAIEYEPMDAAPPSAAKCQRLRA